MSIALLTPVTAAAQSAQRDDPRSTGGAQQGQRPLSRLTDWLELGGEHRLRVESIGRRYRLTETGSDDVLGFRTRVHARVTFPRFIGIAELQDARMGLTDEDSTITNRMSSRLKFSQLSAGVKWRNLGSAQLTVQLEGGRFSRQYGNGRVLARPPYSNVSHSQDGVVLGVNGAAWSVTALAGRPAIYEYPSQRVDDRFRRAFLAGVYATSSRARFARTDAYLLRLDDGSRYPVATRRRLNTTGVRVFRPLDRDAHVDFESETIFQWGTVGPLVHRAWHEHAQMGYAWPAAPLSPHLIALYDHATGDKDPTDARSGAYDPLYARTRFELGPTGIFGLLSRSNLRSPGVWLVTTPAKSLELSIQHRWAWLAEARDRWRSIGLIDATGRSGTEIGTQTDIRVRYQFRHLEIDGAIVYFREGAFVRTLRPDVTGRPVFFALSTEFMF